ncbi:hypothetical protein [Mesorhizobium sp. B2-4-5]|uniref:hypothetical protein n=1 Tax=Mesorhizobium sp. B2-4-5 TaxID=2589944 RepID=UPI00112CE669|nr:hypothetical protein [Mesorhizobium sp. B2-4-5]TPL42597.1 hypothetical protein FJ961_07865 [Mesorhizobium sp. B2-4-5]
MTTLDEVFEAYRDYTLRSKETRVWRQGATGWSTSPLKTFGDWSLFQGKRMFEIPAHKRLPDINPLLIDFHLQMIWARTCTSIEFRLHLLDRLRENLTRERKLHENSIECTRLIIFHGDPHDGTPKEARP